MKITRLLSILFTSITTGLAVAFLVILIKPDLINGQNIPQLISVAGQQVRSSYADAVAISAPSVVNIFATKLTKEQPSQLESLRSFLRYGKHLTPKIRKENSLGSGVVVGENGYILTNHHVIADAAKISISTSGGKTVSARLVGSDPDTDIAVLQAGGDDLPIAAINTSDTIRVGDIVLAIGNPFAVGQTVTQGIISATGRHSLGITTYENFIQTDAAINPGNSGGALINTQGQVIAINTAIFSKSGGSQGIGFAIPIALATKVMQEIIHNGRVIRGWVGLNGQNLTPKLAATLGSKTKSGVLVSAVLNAGPADLTGILPGDIIFKVDGQDIHTTTQILNQVALSKPGNTMLLTIDRQGEVFDATLIVKERPREIP